MTLIGFEFVDHETGQVLGRFEVPKWNDTAEKMLVEQVKVAAELQSEARGRRIFDGAELRLRIYTRTVGFRP